MKKKKKHHDLKDHAATNYHKRFHLYLFRKPKQLLDYKVDSRDNISNEKTVHARADNKLARALNHRKGSQPWQPLPVHTFCPSLFPQPTSIQRAIVQSLEARGHMTALHWPDPSYDHPCLDVFKISKFYKILHHIESLNTCMKY